jgi:hypothetical protein
MRPDALAAPSVLPERPGSLEALRPATHAGRAVESERRPIRPPWGARTALIAFAASWAVGWLPLWGVDAAGVHIGFPWNTILVELALIATVLALRRLRGARWTASDLGWRPPRRDRRSAGPCSRWSAPTS